MKKTSADSPIPDRVVPMSYIRQGRNFKSYEMDSFVRADLIFGEEQDSYKLRVCTESENLILARSKGNEPRTWRSVETALEFIKKHFGVVRCICLLYPQMENEKV
jgi:hypothetical protein